jgi:2'-5' RNA ligase
MTEEPASPFLRLFIAFAVPQEVQKEIGRAQGQLRRSSPPSAIRWTRPEQFHLTLKFLGDLPSDQFEALKISVSRVCAGFSAIKLSAHGVGFFPSEKRPRVIWVGIDDNNGQLAELHRWIDSVVQPFAPTEKTERFIGHITLGRFKPGYHAAIPKLLERATILCSRHFGDWLAAKVEIVRSELTSSGAIHTSLASYPLAK